MNTRTLHDGATKWDRLIFKIIQDGPIFVSPCLNVIMWFNSLEEIFKWDILSQNRMSVPAERLRLGFQLDNILRACMDSL